jgi:hypothetical protein
VRVRRSNMLDSTVTSRGGPVLTVFAIDTFQDDPGVFVAMMAMVALAVVLELAWSRIRTARAAGDDTR